MTEQSIAKTGLLVSITSLFLSTLVSVAALLISGWGLSASISHSTRIEQLTHEQVKLQAQQFRLDQNQNMSDEKRQHAGLYLTTQNISLPLTEVKSQSKTSFLKMVNLGEQPVINAQARWSFQSLPADIVEKDPSIISMVEFYPTEQTIVGKASSGFEQLPRQFELLSRKQNPIPSTDGILELFCENLDGEQFSVSYSFFAHRSKDNMLHIHFRYQPIRAQSDLDDLFSESYLPN